MAGSKGPSRHSRRTWVRSFNSRAAGISTSACVGAEQTGRARQLAQRLDRVLVEHLGMVGRVHELQILGDELEVDQAAAHLLQVPDVVGALLLAAIRSRMSRTSAAILRGRAA